MLWRHKRGLFQAAQNIPILHLRFLSIHQFSISKSKVCETDQSNNFSPNPIHDFPNKFKPTPHIVYSTLLKCQSDLVALNFFFWCAKQNNYFHDRQVFDYMVNVVNRLTTKCKSVKSIVRELKSVGCVIKAQTFLLLLRIYWHGKMYEMVFETFEEMGRFGFTPNTFACNVIMDVLFRIGHVDTAIEVLHEIKSPNFLSFNTAICNLCKLNDLDRLKDVIRNMLMEGYVPNVETFKMVFNCFCKYGRLKEAYEVLGLMTTFGISVSVNTWSMLIDVLCKSHQVDKAFSLLDKMIGTGCSPNVVTYTSLIKGFMESQMVSSAIHILNIMESRGCSPDLVLYNVLIDCFSKTGMYDDALDVFVSLTKQNIIPDSFTLCSLISVVTLSKSFEMFHEIANGPWTEADLVLCNALQSYFCKAGFPSHAVKLYNEIIVKVLTPDNYSFVGLLTGLCDSGRINEALMEYERIVSGYPSVDAHVHTVIIDRLMKAGQYTKGIELFKSAIVKKYTLDIVSYIVAIRGLLKAGRTGEAYSYYSEIKELGAFPDAYVYGSMLSAFCKKKDVKIVEQLLIDVTEAGIRLDSDTLVKVFIFLCRLRASSSALNQIREMLMNDEETRALLCDNVSPHVKVSEANNGCLSHNQFVDSSSSDDLLDVAVSVG